MCHQAVNAGSRASHSQTGPRHAGHQCNKYSFLGLREGPWSLCFYQVSMASGRAGLTPWLAFSTVQRIEKSLELRIYSQHRIA